MLGGGTIGTLAALVLGQYPVEVAVVDPSQPVHLAELGIRAYKTVDALPAGNWDAVWECSGSAAALQAYAVSAEERGRGGADRLPACADRP